jgi:murein L,D-transpeptidase YafK
MNFERRKQHFLALKFPLFFRPMPLPRKAILVLFALGMSLLVQPTVVLSDFGRVGERTDPKRWDAQIVVFKERQILELHENGTKTKSYRICLGMNPIGTKLITGDQKTPEGNYFICSKSTDSKFHRFLGISYPGAADAQAAFERGLISLDDRDAIIESAENGKTPPWNTKLGGWVGIHGYPTDWYRRLWVALFYPKPHNWTDGCIAMWNFEVEELFARVRIGTRVLIQP